MLLLKALLILTTASAVFAKGRIDAIVSGVCLIGQDTSKHDSRGEEVFKDPRNHPAAVASILKYAADRADFHPRQKGVITDQKVYENFLKDMYNFPGFKSHRQQTHQLDLQGDREQFKKEIAKKYSSERNDPQMMARAFEHLLPDEIYVDSQEWLLNYVVMNTKCESGGQCQNWIEVEVVSVMLKLTRVNGDETKIKRQTAEIVLNTFTVNKDYLTQHANSLAQRIRTMDTRKALKELSSTGQLGGEEFMEDDDSLELEAWFQGFDYLPRAYPRWNIQF